MYKIQNQFESLTAGERIDITLLNNHLFYLSGYIDEYTIEKTIKWLVYENLNYAHMKDLVLTLYINSYGGSVTEAFALIDMMKQSSIPISTVGVGAIYSAAFLIFSSGTKGKRYISNRTSAMCHQYSDEIYGKHHDIKAQYKEIELINSRMIQLLCENTGQSTKTIKTKFLSPTDFWLTPKELIEYGVADHILNSGG